MAASWVSLLRCLCSSFSDRVLSLYWEGPRWTVWFVKTLTYPTVLWPLFALTPFAAGMLALFAETVVIGYLRSALEQTDVARQKAEQAEQQLALAYEQQKQEKPTLAELRSRYKETTDVETRTRYQMLLLSQRGQTSSQIAQIVLRSQDTVVRVLKRFLSGGLDAVLRRTAPGRERRVTAAWEAELLRVIE